MFPVLLLELESLLHHIDDTSRVDVEWWVDVKDQQTTISHHIHNKRGN